MAPIDQVQLSFNPQTLTVLNAVLGLVMMKEALEDPARLLLGV